MSQRLGILEVEVEASITLALRMENIDEIITIMRKVILMTESNGLLRTASRAHIGLGWYLETFLIDVNSGLQHYLRSAEYSRRIGDTDSLMFVLSNIYETYIALGELKTVENKVTEFLRGIFVPPLESVVSFTCIITIYYGLEVNGYQHWRFSERVWKNCGKGEVSSNWHGQIST
jgi:hypothetical protein